MKQHLFRSFLTLCGVLACAMQTPSTRVAQAATPDSATCSEEYLPVAIAPGESPEYQIFGRLCSQAPLADQTVQVLVHGGTYSNLYWDSPYEPERYSYVNSFTEAGYATFAIDRIGAGKSSRPPADLVNLDTNAYVLHQVIQALRNGEVGNTPFQRLMLVGHSLGSFIIINEQSKYGGDVDGLILTGFSHSLNPEGLMAEFDNLYPAQLDPRFSETNLPPGSITTSNLPPGYLTTEPGARRNLFYYLPTVEPKVIALDEANKETLTTSELASTIEFDLLNASKAVDVPVLEVIGQLDRFFCIDNICDSTINFTAAEAPNFLPGANLQTFVLLDAGHNINLQLNAPEWYKVAREWSDSFVGTNTSHPRFVPETSYRLEILILAALSVVLLLKPRSSR